MDAQDFRSLQEAYNEVIMGEGKVAWNDTKNPNQSGYTPKEKAQAKVKQLIGDLDKTPSDKDYQRAGNISSTSDEQDVKKTKATHKFPKQGKNVLLGQDKNKTRGQNTRDARKKIGHKYAINQVPKEKQKYYPTEQVDFYDIILSHLLDEGYAETPEAAEAIMVNMSEEWRNSILG